MWSKRSLLCRSAKPFQLVNRLVAGQRDVSKADDDGWFAKLIHFVNLSAAAGDPAGLPCNLLTTELSCGD